MSRAGDLLAWMKSLRFEGKSWLLVLVAQMTFVRFGWIRWRESQAVYCKIMMHISGGRLENRKWPSEPECVFMGLFAAMRSMLGVVVLLY